MRSSIQPHQSMKPIPTVFLLALTVNVASAVTLINGNFETGVDEFVQWPGYTAGSGEAGTNPDNISGWSGEGGRGINPVVPGGGGDSPFDDPSTWNTTNFAFLQGVSHIEQTVTGFSVGADYFLDLDFNSRGCCGDVPVATISLDGMAIASSVDIFGGDGGISTAIDPDPWYHAQISFTASAEEIILRIATEPAAGGDATLVIDNVRIDVIPEPASAALVLLSGLALGFRRKR